MEKIKKSLRREDGFTLVELLAVIVILGIILAIAIPAIGNVVSTSKSNAEAAAEDMIIDAARLYFTVGENTGDSVTVEQLVTSKYIEFRDLEKTPFAKVTGDTVTYIGEVKREGGTYKYIAPDPEG